MTQWLGEKELAARVTGSPFSFGVYNILDRDPLVLHQTGFDLSGCSYHCNSNIGSGALCSLLSVDDPGSTILVAASWQ